MFYLSGSDQRQPLARQKGCVHRYPGATLQVTEAGPGQAYLVATGEYGHDAARAAAVAYRQIAQVLKEDNLEIVQERVFGSRGLWPTVWSARGRMFQFMGLNPQNPLG